MHSKNVLRVNKVIDYIEKHISEELTLAELAKVANLSKFHFQRTFKLITRETPIEYITRKRLEKIASLLIHKTNKSISALSLIYGFQNLSSFSRVFKKHYGFSASELKKNIELQKHLKSSQNSKIGKTSFFPKSYFAREEKIKTWMASNAEIKVQLLPEISLAYIRHWGNPFTIHEAFDKILAWQNKRSTDQSYGDYFTLFHDNPNLTVDDKMQQSAGVEINNLKVAEDEISVLQIPSQKFVIGKFVLSDTEFKIAWDSMIVWINENNLKIIDGPRFERFLDNSLFSSSLSYIVEIGITVK